MNITFSRMSSDQRSTLEFSWQVVPVGFSWNGRWHFPLESLSAYYCVQSLISNIIHEGKAILYKMFEWSYDYAAGSQLYSGKNVSEHVSYDHSNT